MQDGEVPEDSTPSGGKMLDLLIIRIQRPRNARPPGFNRESASNGLRTYSKIMEELNFEYVRRSRTYSKFSSLFIFE
jgi:hypothetical protein